MFIFQSLKESCVTKFITISGTDTKLGETLKR